MKSFVCFLLLAGIVAALGRPDTNAVVPLERVHAHNDYEHKRPLFDALDQGFCSVEGDIFLVEGKLLIAHTTFDLSTKRTLQSLYLDPLRARIKQNGGRLYPNGPECVLLIDFKTAGEPTYAALKEVLKEYSEFLTVFRDGKKETNAITVVLTGGYPRAALAADAVRYAAGDGKLSDLKSNPPANLVPWISEDWTRHFKWRGKGPMPEDERQKLKDLVAQAHQQGRRVRFWDSPDFPDFWKELLADGVDLINTDDLKGFADFWKAGGYK